MNSLDRTTLLNFITSWNAVTGQGVEGTKWRLRGLPSRTKVNKESTDQIVRGSSRISTQDFGEKPVDQNYQNDNEFPRSMRVMASDGATPKSAGGKLATLCKEHETI